MARGRLRHKRVSRLNRAEYRACRDLNMRDAGVMRELLKELRDTGCKKSQVILIEDSAGRLLAWAVVYPGTRKGAAPQAMFYVRHSERRQGQGRRLVDHARKLAEKPHVYPWDEISTAFFRAYGPSKLRVAVQY
jgi:GNAT superfamily N-acetyltransferase